MEAFQAEHDIADEYYHNHLKDGLNFTHFVGCDKFFAGFTITKMTM